MTEAAQRHPVTTLELFFDLVFVFTLTRLTGALEHDLAWETVAHVVLIFVTLFWMYSGYVWLTNAVPPVSTVRRLLMFAGMAAFLVCALAAPDAFGDTAVAFGLGFLVVVIVHAGLYMQSAGRNVVTFAAPNLVHAVALIVAGVLSGWIVYVLWVVPILVDLVTPRLVQRAGAARAAAGTNVFVIDTDHFVERHGELLLVALGESVVAVGVGASSGRLDLAAYASACVGLALAASFWWAWFDADDELAEEALRAASPARRVILAVNAFAYAFAPMLIGIVFTAAGAVHAIGHVGDRLDTAHAALLACGVGLYLFGTATFRRTLQIRPVAVRALVGALALTATLAGRYVGAVSELVLLVLLVVASIAFEPRPHLEMSRQSA